MGNTRPGRRSNVFGERFYSLFPEMTLVEIADALNETRWTISRWASGERAPSLIKIRKIAAAAFAFGVAKEIYEHEARFIDILFHQLVADLDRDQYLNAMFPDGVPDLDSSKDEAREEGSSS